MKARTSRTVQPIRLSRDINAMDKYFMHNSPRDRVLFICGICTGRRISDILSLNVRDVARIDNHGRLKIRERLTIQEGKTGKFADIVIHPKLRNVLSKYLHQRRKKCETLGELMNEPLLKSQKPRRNGEHRITRRHALRVLKEAARACGIDSRIGTHSLRKTFGYKQYQNDVGIEIIQKALNHRSPETTLTYIGITQDDIDEGILSLEW